jgi:hypothetical protein
VLAALVWVKRRGLFSHPTYTANFATPVSQRGFLRLDFDAL